jgi:5-deoxy-glucuronate isomerase
MRTDDQTRERMEKWNILSPETAGLHHCIRPGAADCREINIFRLNLPANEDFALVSGTLEMDAVLLKGEAGVEARYFSETMGKFDSFYIPGGCSVNMRAFEDSIFYIGAAVCENFGKPFFRKFDRSLPLGEIRQIHGRGTGRREVFFTLNPEIPASRLLCGLTWGGEGGWTSWPPHQHEKDLEEAYCYFDMDHPKFGLHLSYLKSGETNNAVAHPVRSGSMILAPCGYHPTVASPGTVNSYFWVLASFSHDSRRYDLAVLDPAYAD